VKGPPQDSGSVASKKSIASKKSTGSAPKPECFIESVSAVAAVQYEEEDEEELLPEPKKENVRESPPEEYNELKTHDTLAFLDDLEKKSEDVQESEYEEIAADEPEDDGEPVDEPIDEPTPAAQISPAPFVDEDDDDFSFGSDEGEEPNHVEEDELDDFLGSNSESNSQDEPNELELDEPMDSIDIVNVNANDLREEIDEASVKEPFEEEDDEEMEDGIEVVKTKTESQEYEEVDNDDDMEYENENDVPEQEPEDDYDEKEDLDHMDSLDLVLDATKSNEEDELSAEEHAEVFEEEEDEFPTNDVGHVEEAKSPYIILKSEKYHPEYGFEEIEPEDLDLKETLEAFEDGDISKEEIAILLIEAMFDRDFVSGDHWEIDSGAARELEEDEGGGGDLEGHAFVVKRQARLDWNDIYSVAAAKGTIIIDPEKKELRVENYSYFVAG